MRLLPPRQRGATLVIALALMVLLGTALATLGGSFGQQVRRTRAEAAQAQLRQLLLAGIQAADSPRQTLALPEPLAERGATVRLSREVDQSDRRVVVVTATLDGHRRASTVTLRSEDDGWRVVKIEP